MAEIIFHPDTAHEIKRSYEWYQNQAEGLGDDFIAELESAYETIAERSQNVAKIHKKLPPVFVEQISVFSNLSGQ